MAKLGVRDRDRGWSRILKQAMAAHKGAKVRVGVLGDKAEERDGEGGLTVGEIAAVQEFGDKRGHIPERSFIRSTFDHERLKLKEIGAKLLARLVFDQDGLTIEQALGVMGLYLQTAIKNRVMEGEGIPPPNAPSTARAKAGTGRTAKFFKHAARTVGDALAQVGALAAVRPLVDTGRMIGALTWQVVIGGKASGESGGGGKQE